MGIAHGYATLGRIGFEGRFDYAAIGVVTNLASRLCDKAASGEILVSQRVHAEIDGQFRTEPLGEVAIRGMARAQLAYRLIEAEARV